MAMKTCFISAPAGAPLGVLRAALESRGLRVLVPQDLTAGSDWASEIQKQLSQADIVIGVLTSERQSPWVLFELGQASALGRRIVLITSPKSDPIPFALHQILVLRIDLDNQDAIGFALDQVLSAPDLQPKKSPTSQKKTISGLGTKTDHLLAAFDLALASNDFRSLEQIVADALQSSGADVIAPSPSRDIGADFAVWSDVLEPFVGNPLIVEIKARIRGRSDATRALKQLRSYLDASGSRWALLLYGEGPAPENKAWSDCPPNILALPLRSLLEALRTQAFPEVVRDLRNRRVHGSSS
jgi:hypothetical protein